MCLVKDIFWQDDISTHALREEGDAQHHPDGPEPTQFLPTPSARRATKAGAVEAEE